MPDFSRTENRRCADRKKEESKMVAFCGNILVMLVTVGIFIATVNFGQTPSSD